MFRELSKSEAEKFRELCDWLFQMWQLRKLLFDENPDVEVLKGVKHQDLFNRLLIVLQEYWLLQLAKIHDPAQQMGSYNLTLAYVLDFGPWDDATKGELNSLYETLQTLFAKIKSARHKVICHNDLSILLENQTLCEFEDGDDLEYFDALQAFLEIICQRMLDQPFVYDDLVQNDVETLMSSLLADA